MNLKFLVLVGTLLATGITTAYAQVPPQTPISSCQKVNYPIGLNIRSAPNSSSRRIGSVGYGQKVRLAGTLKKAGTGSSTVIPTTAKDEYETTWVKIQAPVRGFVLFVPIRERNSLIPC